MDRKHVGGDAYEEKSILDTVEKVNVVIISILDKITSRNNRSVSNNEYRDKNGWMYLR